MIEYFFLFAYSISLLIYALVFPVGVPKLVEVITSVKRPSNKVIVPSFLVLLFELLLCFFDPVRAPKIEKVRPPLEYALFPKLIEPPVVDL